MIGQCHAGNEEREWQIVSLYGLQQPQQGVLGGSLPSSHNRPSSGLNFRELAISFLNAYLGHNQIPMHEPDKEKIAFMVKQDTYCYKVMTFVLNNT